MALDYKLTDPIELALQRALNRLLAKDHDIRWRDIIKAGAKEVKKLNN